MNRSLRPAYLADRDQGESERRRSDIAQDELDSDAHLHRGRIDVPPGVWLAGSSEREPGDDNGVRTRAASAVVPVSSPK